MEHTNANDEILECHAITGEGSHLLKVRTANTASLEKLLAKIQAWSGVLNTRTNLVLSTSKETMRIKVEASK
jgi:Lrp/AsnC family leucine-responsive transcriptional regulator